MLPTGGNEKKDSGIGGVFLSLRDVAAPLLVAGASTLVIASSDLSWAGAQAPDPSKATAALTIHGIRSPQQVTTSAPVAPTTAVPGAVTLVNQAGQLVQPAAVVLVGSDLYFLDPQTLWIAKDAVHLPAGTQQMLLTPLGPAKTIIGTTPMQEFSNMSYCPAKNALEILDKSGDLFEFDLKTKAFRVLRPNSPLGSPDPEYIDMTVSGKHVLLLDPERNQIWRYPATSARYFHEVMPWRLRPGDVTVADGLAIAYDGDTWVLRKGGSIGKFNAGIDTGLARQLPFHWVPPKHFRPTRLYTAPGLPLFTVERENNRVLTIDKNTSAIKQYLFPANSNLRGIVPLPDRFLAIDGPTLVTRLLAQPDALTASINNRRIDTRLEVLSMPLKSAILPRHAGVWPGARRLYRYGIHKGTDFFSDAGAITMGTPVFASDAGRVVRCDGDFRDMDAPKYSRVMYECHHSHITSEHNEDLLRGCQVWIDHGGGLITKYAHLDRIKPGLRVGMRLSRGEQVGYVGVSGTGENLPGRGKHPHLHFEIWLDGHYVGYGLTPAETIGVLEDIFGTPPRSRNGRGVRRA